MGEIVLLQGKILDARPDPVDRRSAGSGGPVGRRDPGNHPSVGVRSQVTNLGRPKPAVFSRFRPMSYPRIASFVVAGRPWAIGRADGDCDLRRTVGIPLVERAEDGAVGSKSLTL